VENAAEEKKSIATTSLVLTCKFSKSTFLSLLTIGLNYTENPSSPLQLSNEGSFGPVPISFHEFL